MDQTLNQPNRINLSLGRKINIGNYESVDIHVSLSSDQQPDESLEEAQVRVTAQLLSYFETARKEVTPVASRR